MRYGVVSDIHGNLHALEAALDRLERERVDAYLCLGDLVGYGPYPNECVRRVRDLGALVVAGNHDLIAVGRLAPDGIGRLARESLDWTRPRLDADSRRFLEDLPAIAVPEPALVMTHGALGDPARYVSRPEDAAAELGRLRTEHPDASVLLLGHTHVPMVVAERTGRRIVRRARTLALPESERVVLNPGAVGQARQRQPHGWSLVLDTDARRAEFNVVRYDVGAGRRALAAHGLAAESFHRPPSIRRALRRRARRLVQR